MIFRENVHSSVCKKRRNIDERTSIQEQNGFATHYEQRSITESMDFYLLFFLAVLELAKLSSLVEETLIRFS